MSKESLYTPEDRRISFRETFNDEQTVRRVNNGQPTDVTFTNGRAGFNAGSSVIVYKSRFINPSGFSVRMKINKTDLSGNEYLFMKRTTDDVAFIFYFIDDIVYFYSGGALVANAASKVVTSVDDDIEIVGVYDGTDTKVYVNAEVGTDASSPLAPDQFDTDMYLGENYGGGSSDYYGDMDLVEIHTNAFTAEGVANISEGKRFTAIGTENGILDVGSGLGSIIDRYGNILIQQLL